MNQENWTLLINAFKWLGGGLLFAFTAFKAWREYLEKQNERTIAIAKEKSVGEQAIKMIEADIALIEKEIESVKAFKSKSETDYTILHTLIDKLRDDYKFIMDRIFPSNFKQQ